MITLKSTLAFAALATITVSCISNEEHRRALDANRALRTQLAELTNYHQQLSGANDRLTEQVERLGKSAADAQWIKEQKEKLAKLLGEYREGGPKAMPGVELVETREGLAFRVLGGVLFASGKVDITSEGQSTLQQLVQTLRNEDKDIRVDGHTDDQKIVYSPWKTNLRLSANRALAVAEFLIASGLPKERISACGHGEYKPAVPGSSEEARRANRRVEIVMLDR